MNATRTADRLLTWSLATFEATVLLLVLVLLSFRGGGLGNTLSGLTPALGLGLFGLLWLTAILCTGKATQELNPLQANPGIGFPGIFAGAWWGAANGLLFFLLVLGLALPAIAIASASDHGLSVGTLAKAVGGILFFGFFGAIAASLIGAIVGVLFAFVNMLLFDIARLTVTTDCSSHQASANEDQTPF